MPNIRLEIWILALIVGAIWLSALVDALLTSWGM